MLVSEDEQQEIVLESAEHVVGDDNFPVWKTWVFPPKTAPSDVKTLNYEQTNLGWVKDSALIVE